MSLSNSILKFFVRFILYNIIVSIIWFFIHSYYETILWFFAVKASQLFGPLSLTHPNIIDGNFVCRLGNADLHFSPSTISMGIVITIPLLLSSSGTSLTNKIKMTIAGLSFLFFFQYIYLFVILYNTIYQNYALYLEKGIGIEQIITYTRVKHVLILWLNLFFSTILQFAVAIGIWIGLVSYYKRSEKQHWIRRLF